MTTLSKSNTLQELPAAYCNTPFTRYNRLSNRTGSVSFYQRIWRYINFYLYFIFFICIFFYLYLSKRLHNRFDNRLYRVNKHPTGCQASCQTGLTTGWMFVCMIQPVWQPCRTNSHCSFNRLSNRVVQPVWQPAVYTIQPAVKPVWQPLDNRLYRVNGA